MISTPPLARALHSVPLDNAVPKALFEAVAVLPADANRSAGSLRDVPLFEGLTPAQLEVIAGCGSNVQFREGELLFKDRDPAESFRLFQSRVLVIYDELVREFAAKLPKLRRVGSLTRGPPLSVQSKRSRSPATAQ